MKLRLRAELIPAPDGGAPLEVSAVEWGGVLEGVDAQSVIDQAGPKKQSPRSEKAANFLKAQLASAMSPETAVPLQTLLDRAASVGISKQALYEARDGVGVRATGKSFGGEAGWYIPSDEEKSPAR